MFSASSFRICGPVRHLVLMAPTHIPTIPNQNDACSGIATTPPCQCTRTTWWRVSGSVPAGTTNGFVFQRSWAWPRCCSPRRASGWQRGIALQRLGPSWAEGKFRLRAMRAANHFSNCALRNETRKMCLVSKCHRCQQVDQCQANTDGIG